MVTAIVLLTVSRGRVGEVAEELASQEGISEVYSVAGRFDLVALVRVKANEDLADVVTKRLQRIDGIESRSAAWTECVRCLCRSTRASCGRLSA